jgi:hypothetical protein
MDGKSLTEMKFNVASTFVPVPYASLDGTTIIFLFPKISRN